LRPQLEQQIKAERIEHLVRLPGYLARVDRVLDQAACLAQPSLTEGLPITLLEAMGRRIPVIASRVGGMPLVLENGAAGTLVPPADPEALRSAIHNVLTNHVDIAKKTENAHNLFATKYSAAKMADRYQGIYNTCMGR
jgi:glycosyltransferase involved in cell wall biosynthesis